MKTLVDLSTLPSGVKLAVSYLRVSTSAQADKDYGTRLAKAVNLPLSEVTKAASEYRAAYPDQFPAN